jgi:sugar lactone lactonase YvrE
LPADKELAVANHLAVNLPTVSNLYEVLTVGRGSAISPPDRICSSSQGVLYYSSSYSNQIFQLIPTGKTTLLANLPNDGSGTRAIRGLKAGESGTVYAVLVKANQIVKIDQKKHITYIPVSVGLNQPNDLAISPDSTLYIADSENQRVVKVTLTEEQLYWRAKPV